jgi:hypothetical protein
MNSLALITAITLAADFNLAAAAIIRARMLKTLRKSLTARLRHEAPSALCIPRSYDRRAGGSASHDRPSSRNGGRRS